VGQTLARTPYGREVARQKKGEGKEEWRWEGGSRGGGGAVRMGLCADARRARRVREGEFRGGEGGVGGATGGIQGSGANSHHPQGANIEVRRKKKKKKRKRGNFVYYVLNKLYF
jgi:hypothetical protein